MHTYCFQHFKVFYTHSFLCLFSGMEEAMEGAAPVDQSAQESPKGPFTDSTPTPSYSHDVSKPPPPYSPLVIPLLSSPSTISPVTNSPDIPIQVEYLSDPIPVPSPPFLLPGYSSPISTPSFTSLSTSHVSIIITNSTITSFSSQDAPHSVPLPRSTPIIGSLSLPSQTLIDPCPSSSYSSVPSKVIPSSDPTLPPSYNTLSLRKPRGGHSIRGKSSRGYSTRGKSPGGQRRGSRTFSGHSSHLISSSQNLSSSQCPILPWGYPPVVRALDLSTRPRVSSNLPQNPTINPFFTNYSCSPKVFSPIFFFNEPSEYVFTCFLSFTPVTFSLARTTGPCWCLQLNGETYLLCSTLIFHLI